MMFYCELMKLWVTCNECFYCEFQDSIFCPEEWEEEVNDHD